MSKSPLIISVLLSAANTWTMLTSDVKTLQAFNKKCHSQILHLNGSSLSERTFLNEILLAQVEVTNKHMSRKLDNGVGKKLR